MILVNTRQILKHKIDLDYLLPKKSNIHIEFEEIENASLKAISIVVEALLIFCFLILSFSSAQ